MNIIAPTYLCLKTSSARKTSQYAEGAISYALLKDIESSSLFFTLTANEGGGYFSRELIPFQRITQCIAGIKANQPLPAKVFRAAFVGKSSNNAGFLVAVLRHEGLLAAARDASQQHVLAGDWPSWSAALLKQTGEPYQLPRTPETATPVVPVVHSGDGCTPIPNVEDDGSPRKGKKSRKVVASAIADVSTFAPHLDEDLSIDNLKNLSHVDPA